MSDFITSDQNYYLTQESYNFLNNLIETDIRSGKITKWAQFLITIKLGGVDINAALLNYLITGSSCGEIYDILKGLLRNIDDFDPILKSDMSFLNKIVKSNNSIGFYHSKESGICGFKSLDVIKEIDDRNPTIMVRYFLNTNIIDLPEHDREAYRICMCEIMKRSKLRGIYNPIFLKKYNEMKDKFEEERGILSYV